MLKTLHGTINASKEPFFSKFFELLWNLSSWCLIPDSSYQSFGAGFLNAPLSKKKFYRCINTILLSLITFGQFLSINLFNEPVHLCNYAMQQYMWNMFLSSDCEKLVDLWCLSHELFQMVQSDLVNRFN